MKPIMDMTRLEFAAFIATEFRRRKINVVLSGGSCVSIYSQEKYVSMDLDFVNEAFAKRLLIKAAMESLGFHEENRYFRHPDTEFLVEFPPGPLGVGEEPVKQINEINTDTGVLRIISPTDCVKDRLAWFYHDNDTECLEQAVLVAETNDVDITEIKRWSRMEGKSQVFHRIRHRLTTKARQRVMSKSVILNRRGSTHRSAPEKPVDAVPAVRYSLTASGEQHAKHHHY